MAFHELGFLFIFFPVAMLLYFLVPKVAKTPLMVALSLVFFAWGSMEFVILLILLIVFNFFTGLQLDALKEKEKTRKMVLISAVAVDVLLLGFFKYRGFLVENINTLLKTGFTVSNTAMPLGVSFFTFSILSFLFDVYREKTPAPKNILNFALFVSFFPKLVSGPIVSYHDFAAQMEEERKVTLSKVGSASRLFLIGLAKKLLIADILGTTFTAVTALPLGEVSTVTAWLGALCYAMMLYFDFSGYSDMAIGIAQMCGFTFEKNFDYPYMAVSITDFWRRWHISLGAWFRDYIYFPLGGSRVDKIKVLRNLLAVWLLTGIWHGASWTFILWGLYHGGVQMLEKFVLKKALDKAPQEAKVVLTFLAVLVGWVFFFAPSLGFAFTWLGRMLGIGAKFVDGAAKYYLAGCWKILLIACLGASPLPARLAGRIYRSRSNLPVVLSVIWFGFLLILCIAVMTGSTYSSFLYFQF